MAIFLKDRYIGERYILLQGRFTGDVKHVPRLANFESDENYTVLLPASNKNLADAYKEQGCKPCQIVVRAYHMPDAVRYKLLWIVENQTNSKKEEECL